MEGVVVVKSVSYFRGLDAEGSNGHVKPGDILRLASYRAADLRAHRLIEPTDYVEPPPAPVVPASVPVVKQKVK